MLKELVTNQGLDFTVICGISIGALNAAFLVQASIEGNSLTNLQARVVEMTDIRTQEIESNDSIYEYEESVGGIPGISGGAGSLYLLEPLKKLLKKHLSTQVLQDGVSLFTYNLSFRPLLANR